MSLYISSSKKRLIKKFCWFISPILLLLCILYVPFIYVGEVLFVQQRIDSILDNDKEYLFGNIIDADQRLRYVKYQQLIRTSPVVVSIGSSRVLQFREQMFNQPFYNFGYTINRIEDSYSYLNLFTKIGVKYVILGLDHWMFNPEWLIKQNLISFNDVNSNLSNFEITSPRKLYKSFLKVIVSLSGSQDLQKSMNLLGLNAFKGSGIRRDGSYLYGELINKIYLNDTTIEDYRFKNTLDRIAKKTSRFEKFIEIDTSSINSLIKIIKFCSLKKIHLVVFLAPVANEVYQSMNKDTQYPMFFQLPNVLDSLARSHNVVFLNYENFKSVGESDKSAIDGFHGSERIYGKIALDIAAHDSLFKRIINSKYIREQLHSRNRFHIVNP